MEQLIKRLKDAGGESNSHLVAFLEFHKDNPGVWNQVKRMSGDLRDKGRKHYAISTIIEVIRHHTILGYSDPDRDFKINNNHKGAYARLYNYQCGFAFFELRSSYWERLDPPVIGEVLAFFS